VKLFYYVGFSVQFILFFSKKTNAFPYHFLTVSVVRSHLFHHFGDKNKRTRHNGKHNLRNVNNKIFLHNNVQHNMLVHNERFWLKKNLKSAFNQKRIKKNMFSDFKGSAWLFKYFIFYFDVMCVYCIYVKRDWNFICEETMWPQ
jgi:hypothetical protein